MRVEWWSSRSGGGRGDEGGPPTFWERCSRQCIHRDSSRDEATALDEGINEDLQIICVRFELCSSHHVEAYVHASQAIELAELANQLRRGRACEYSTPAQLPPAISIQYASSPFKKLLSRPSVLGLTPLHSYQSPSLSLPTKRYFLTKVHHHQHPQKPRLPPTTTNNPSPTFHHMRTNHHSADSAPASPPLYFLRTTHHPCTHFVNLPTPKLRVGLRQTFDRWKPRPLPP